MKTGEVAIRAERSGDEDSVRAVHCAAFPTDAEARLVDSLRSHGNTLVSLVAVSDRQIVGHVVFSPVCVAQTARCEGAGLAPLAVLPAFQRRGLGTRLIEAGTAACRQAGIAFVVVLGDPGYYGRLGFLRASALGLDNEYGVDEEFRVLELIPGSLQECRGLAKYGAEFSALSGS